MELHIFFIGNHGVLNEGLRLCVGVLGEVLVKIIQIFEGLIFWVGLERVVLSVDAGNIVVVHEVGSFQAGLLVFK